MPELLTNPLSIILLFTTLISTTLYLREYNQRKKLKVEGDRILENFKEKGLETLHSSIKKSQDIIGQAELEGVKVVADARLTTTQLEDQYKEKLKDLIDQSQQSIVAAQGQFLQFMKYLENQSNEFEQTNRQASEGRINHLFDNLESKLSDFLIKTETKTTTSIELELKGARQLIDTYKTQQFKLIDENIIAMMEQTLNIVLAKKLTLKDHVDLVYEALERAKVEKFIV